jgi:predicted solute-binding protein
MEAVQETNLWGVQKIILGVPRRCCALPLIRGLADLPHIVLLRDGPLAIARRFRDSEIDCALLPVIECLARAGTDVAPEWPPFKVIPGIGISTEGDSMTEVLFTRAGISETRRVVADFTQGGMLALARIVLAEQGPRVPEIAASSDPAAATTADGAVVSGDDAFTSACPFPFRHDLGELWRQLTDLPLVHLVWVVRRGIPFAELRRLLALALQKGLEEIDQIAAKASQSCGVSIETARSYLTETVRYRRGAAEMDGLRKFTELAVKHRLCDPRSEIHLC